MLRLILPKLVGRDLPDDAPGRWGLGLGPHVNDSKIERWMSNGPSPIDLDDDATIADEFSGPTNVAGPQLGYVLM